MYAQQGAKPKSMPKHAEGMFLITSHTFLYHQIKKKVFQIDLRSIIIYYLCYVNTTLIIHASYDT